MNAGLNTGDSGNALAFEVTHRMVLSIAIPMTLGFITTPLLGLVGTGVVGRMGDPDALAGLAIGAMLFDLILGSFNFLRASTTGLTAQAYGRRERHAEQGVFWRAILSALGCGVALLFLSPLLLAAGLKLMGPENAVAQATSTYFSIRILAAPAALANYAILGFVLVRGQGSVGLLLQSMINGVNIVLAIALGLWLDWGIAGVAWATTVGETIGALAGLFIVLTSFGRGAWPKRREIFAWQPMAELFTLNRDILIRTFVAVGAYAVMTRIGSGFGAVTLAANAVLMNFLMLSGFYLDGLANAAEQITGRAVGARHRPAFDRGLKLTAIWSFGLAGVISLFLFLAGDTLIAALTTSSQVRQVASLYLPWAAITGLTGALAFLMDGVFIGATWSSDMRNRMLMSFAIYLAAVAILVPLLANHGLWLAINLFLLSRGLLLVLRVKQRADQTFRPAQ